MRIGFFGTPSLAATVLANLTGAPDIDVIFVVTNPDKPFGRDQMMRASPVKELAIMNSIPVLQPTKIRDNTEFFDQLREYDCDYFIVVAYGRILPLELLHIPSKMCINVHGSLLPAYRGASPIQSALLNGEKETGVTIMEMSEGMDEGDMLKVRTIEIDPTETSESLFAKFALVSGPTLIQTLRELETGGITPLPQDPAVATYCKKIDKEDGLIDWSKSAKEIYQMWQAYTPWPGIYTKYEGKRLKMEEIYFFRNDDMVDSTLASDDEIGAVIRLPDNQIGVVCSDGILTLSQVKLEGKKSQSIKDFVNGNQKFIGVIL
ncbi:methionyl-tRNA formyltransferase [Candidatus Gracilibacteria bacterium]|nr:methionyl-tRNA formyltransferase [Candidatus Gracilibacteria bacterium]